VERKATFGAGCFWGVEAAFRRLDGVTRTRVGYAGGGVENPSYEQVCYDGTGHAEVVEVTFDDEKIPYEQLLAVFEDAPPFWEAEDYHQQYLEKRGLASCTARLATAS
jgi:methionine-S-sulfoxide reductase